MCSNSTEYITSLKFKITFSNIPQQVTLENKMTES